MTGSEAVAEKLAERWLACLVSSYPLAARAALGGNINPFRNPVGHALGENLRKLAQQLLGEMDCQALAAPLDAIVRLRAVQAFSPSQALGFIFELRATAAQAGCEIEQKRIDTLALMAFDQYMRCREQIFELRLQELRSPLRATAPPE